MKIVASEQAEVFGNSSTSKLLEYSIALGEKDIDFCINTITWRYPEKGFCSNQVCKELCYILEWNWTINKKDEKINFKKGDVIFIDNKEIYYREGDCKIAMICTPARYKDQCKLYDE